MALPYNNDEEFTYIQLYDYTTPYFAILRIKMSERAKFLEIVANTRKLDSYNLDADGNSLIEELARNSIDYERVEPEKVYF